jgi:alpha-ketoglutarate-dependent taurine dioxygenase
METIPLFDEFGCMVMGNGKRLTDLAGAEVHAAMSRYGAVLFRRFDADSDAFEAFSSTLCDAFYSHPHPKRVPVGKDGFSNLASPKHDPILLHTERGYEPRFARPQLLWFHCVRPASADGETLLCDGAQLWSRLPLRVQELFTRNRLLYVLTLPGPLLRGHWSKHFITSVRRTISREDVEKLLKDDVDVEYAFLQAGKLLVLKLLISAVTTSAFDGRVAFANTLLNRRFSSFVQFEDCSPIEEGVLCEIDAVAAPITFPIAWEAGDVLLIDNERVMHGRRAHKDSNRELHVRFGRDRFASAGAAKSNVQKPRDSRLMNI